MSTRRDGESTTRVSRVRRDEQRGIQNSKVSVSEIFLLISGYVARGAYQESKSAWIGLSHHQFNTAREVLCVNSPFTTIVHDANFRSEPHCTSGTGIRVSVLRFPDEILNIILKDSELTRAYHVLTNELAHTYEKGQLVSTS